MMYTSQEGEIYAGQARASGAVGVLPKSIRPIDVTKALYQLKLLPDRRDGEPSALEPVEGGERVPASPPPAAAGGPDPGRAAGRGAAEGAEPRTAQVHRLDARFLHAPHRRRAAAEGAGGAARRGRTAGRRRRRRAALGAGCSPRRRGSAALVVVGVAVLAGAGSRPSRRSGHSQALTASNETLTQGDREVARRGRSCPADAAAQERLPPARARRAIRGASRSTPARLETVRALVAQLERAAISGIVRVENFAGSFCLTGAGEHGYTLAPARNGRPRSASRSAIPIDDTQSGAARQPIAFANLAASVRRRTDGAIELELVPGPRDRLAVCLPADRPGDGRPVERGRAGQQPRRDQRRPAMNNAPADLRRERLHGQPDRARGGGARALRRCSPAGLARPDPGARPRNSACESRVFGLG